MMIKKGKLIFSWVIGVCTVIAIALVYRHIDVETREWVIVSIVGYLTCVYLRKDIKKSTKTTKTRRHLEEMEHKVHLVTAIYYWSVLCVLFYMVLSKPHVLPYPYSDGYYLLFLFIMVLPHMPAIVMRELETYQLAGREDA